MTNEITKTVFLAGCGGGYDIFGGLPHYFKIKSSENYDVTLINYSFTKRHLLSKYSQQLTTLLFRVDPRLDVIWLTDDVYFPEQRLANELQVPIYAILCDYDETRIELIIEAYKYLIQERTIDELILIDGGSDVLLTGNEKQLGTPVEDMSHARAVHLLSSDKVKSKYIVVIGTNLEVGHGVHKSDIDTRLTALSSHAIFTWLWQYEHDDAVRYYVDIFTRCCPRHSIVHSLICAALQGRTGYYLPEHLRSRITKSIVSIGEETCVSTGYHFDDVMRENVYFERLTPTLNLRQVHDVILIAQGLVNQCSENEEYTCGSTCIETCNYKPQICVLMCRSEYHDITLPKDLVETNDFPWIEHVDKVARALDAFSPDRNGWIDKSFHI
ncbi:unnamed protein product [Rotaria sordida]|uniref:DUF1152 domain-containing protein n=1 Tax=Rotaria sordida TaxID=392033 RepID=A0A815EPP7_9BILA|nr:unnamed protein product [Rotaria sordida]